MFGYNIVGRRFVGESLSWKLLMEFFPRSQKKGSKHHFTSILKEGLPDKAAPDDIITKHEKFNLSPLPPLRMELFADPPHVLKPRSYASEVLEQARDGLRPGLAIDTVQQRAAWGASKFGSGAGSRKGSGGSADAVTRGSFSRGDLTRRRMQIRLPVAITLARVFQGVAR